MSVPSMKSLQALRGAAAKCTRGNADEILQCLRFAMQGRRPEAALVECNTLLDGFGIELITEDGSVYPSRTDGSDIMCYYVNLGDTYTATILYDCERDRYLVTSWGDFYERSEAYRLNQAAE